MATPENSNHTRGGFLIDSPVRLKLAAFDGEYSITFDKSQKEYVFDIYNLQSNLPDENADIASWFVDLRSDCPYSIYSGACLLKLHVSVLISGSSVALKLFLSYF